MTRNMAESRPSDPVRSLETVRPEPAKAGLRPSDAVRSADRIGPVVKAAVVKHYGSVKAAAITLGADPSLLMRELEAGKFSRLEATDADCKRDIAKALFDAFGQDDPIAHASRLIRDGRRVLDELSELLLRRVS